MSSPHRSSDKGAAFLGLIIGALSIAVLLVGIVAWTNSRYAAHEGGTPAASTPAASTPAQAGTPK